MKAGSLTCSLTIAAAFVVALAPRASAGQHAAAGGARPPVPYVARGACPFECCTYRDWVTERVTPVRAAPVRGARVVFRTRAGEPVRGDSGHVLVSRPGVVVARSPFGIDGSDGRDSVLTVQRGDTLYALDYEGEGTWHVWYRGAVREMAANWDWPGGPISRPGAPPAHMTIAPKSEWWAHVTRRSGAGGWVLMDSTRVGNVDACG